MASVELRGVSKSYGNVELIKNLDLKIAGSAVTAFVGPSGCGKSTLLRMVAGPRVEAVTATLLEPTGRP